uniref:Glutamate decarboxylase-like protein 1-like n=1 Tax=Neolamprologus brichardi TaxID=32507 RepID=A0A3Q4M9X0_NEOBR
PAGSFDVNGSTADEQISESFIRQAMEIIVDEAVKKATNVQEKVCEWHSPEQLKKLLDLELRDRGEPESEILQRCRDAIRYSVKTSHPRFFNQLYAGMEPYSMVASFIAEAVKTNLYTYEVAPVFTLMEDAVLRKMIKVIGWEEGGDGIFNPGGSLSNIYGVNLARYRYCPDFKEVGMFSAPRLVILTSQEVMRLVNHLIFLSYHTKSLEMGNEPKDNISFCEPRCLEPSIPSTKLLTSVRSTTCGYTWM